MSAIVFASSYLSASLLAMLVPIAAVLAIVAWGLLLIRRHERRREGVHTRDPSAAGPNPAEGSPPARSG